MGDTSDDLGAQLKAAAEQKVGGKALTSKFGLDCFALVDKLLRTLDAKTAADYGKVTATADYTWGDGIMLDSIQAGDILQFRNHVVDSGTWKFVNGKWFETEGRTQTRPHHTAIVLEVAKNGSVTVVEQNVQPHPNKVIRNVIPRLAEGVEERPAGSGVKIKLKVTGTVKAYRPVPKPKKGASLLRPLDEPAPGSGWRMLAYFIPSQGGAKRSPGPTGMGGTAAPVSPAFEGRWPSDDLSA
ncbi:MAG: hypothetical protein H6R23_813 [Proteobacteria bacterium]|nr:hypothetical protein [Pseudomonadota bacterium]